MKLVVYFLERIVYNTLQYLFRFPRLISPFFHDVCGVICYCEFGNAECRAVTTGLNFAVVRA